MIAWSHGMHNITGEPSNSVLKGTGGFHALSREMPYCQYLELKSIWGLRIYVIIGGFSLLADALLQGSSVPTMCHALP